ncbi:MAG: hypothetical protein EBS06_04425 [Proteobacteria bacterium]|nr:hypothetical protein [Pseudomonadota bacterium]
MFSVVLATRSGATEFSGPLKLLKDMRNQMSDPNNFEIIIRGDDDDEKLPEFQKLIEAEKFPFRTVVISGSRSRGYDDLHKFYNECFVYLSPQTQFIFSLPEDVEIQVDHWDKFLIDEYESAKSQFKHPVFTMHQSLLPGDSNYDSCLENPDSFPIYSKEWICSVGGFSHTGANDSWIQAVHHFLVNDHGLMIRHFLSRLVFLRNTDSHDSVASVRWANARLRNHELMRRSRVKAMIKIQALTLYNLTCYYKATSDRDLSYNEVKKFNQNPSELEYINFLCDRDGSGAVLFKIYFSQINGKTVDFIDSRVEELKKLYQRILRLKTIVPNYDPKFADIYDCVNGDLKNLKKEFGPFCAINPKYAVKLSQAFENYRKLLSQGIKNSETLKNISEAKNSDKQLLKIIMKEYGYRRTILILLKEFLFKKNQDTNLSKA